MLSILFGCHGNSWNPFKVPSVTLKTTHTCMCQRCYLFFSGSVYFKTQPGCKSNNDYSRARRIDFLTQILSAVSKGLSVGRNEMVKLKRAQNMWHVDRKGLAASSLLSCISISRQPCMSGATTVHATNYDSWRENCSTDTETHWTLCAAVLVADRENTALVALETASLGLTV